MAPSASADLSFIVFHAFSTPPLSSNIFPKYSPILEPPKLPTIPPMAPPIAVPPTGRIAVPIAAPAAAPAKPPPIPPPAEPTFSPAFSLFISINSVADKSAPAYGRALPPTFPTFRRPFINLPPDPFLPGLVSPLVEVSSLPGLLLVAGSLIIEPPPPPQQQQPPPLSSPLNNLPRMASNDLSKIFFGRSSTHSPNFSLPHFRILVHTASAFPSESLLSSFCSVFTIASILRIRLASMLLSFFCKAFNFAVTWSLIVRVA